MITDNDIEKIKEKLKTTFATKDELRESENRLIEVITSIGNAIIKDIKEDINNILENHERRIQRLELQLPVAS